MNANRQIFVNTYLTNGYDATDAYRTAYPKCKAGHQQSGSRLLLIAVVKEAISQAKKELEDWLRGSRETVDRLFSDQYKACVVANDRGNAIRCLENKGKNVGYFAEDNAQKTEQQALNNEQQALYDEYLAYRRRKLLKGTG